MILKNFCNIFYCGKPANLSKKKKKNGGHNIWPTAFTFLHWLNRRWEKKIRREYIKKLKQASTSASKATKISKDDENVANYFKSHDKQLQSLNRKVNRRMWTKENRMFIYPSIEALFMHLRNPAKGFACIMLIFVSWCQKKIIYPYTKLVRMNMANEDEIRPKRFVSLEGTELGTVWKWPS